MRFLTPLLLLAAPAMAEISVEAPTAVRAYPTAPTAAVYMAIHNDGPEDRLVAVRTEADIARTEVHRTETRADGTMAMAHQQDGVPVPGDGHLLFLPGGLHVMLMGLGAVETDSPLALTLVFETAGDVTVEVPWGARDDLADLLDMAGHHDADGPESMDHGAMDHGAGHDAAGHGAMHGDEAETLPGH